MFVVNAFLMMVLLCKLTNVILYLFYNNNNETLVKREPPAQNQSLDAVQKTTKQ